ncbi:MAG: WecB/TagA/CpsF family glycosyltransferase [Ignavibacteria bacterium]|nr:WecB/TagA/CpsF family glycosyltransferase [Ignavibacteria bacterium]
MIINNLLLTPEKIFNEIFGSVEARKNLLLTYLNQNSFNIYFRNENYKRLLDTKFTVYQADLGVFLFLKFMKKEKISRIDATSLNTNIVCEIIKKGIPIGFVGGNFSESFIKEECYKRRINLAGYYPGYFDEEQVTNIISMINQFKSRVYFIGMGVPKQEFFAYELSKTSDDKIIVCVGNFLEFYFGRVKRAPVVFRKLGIEWLFRLITEPKRLWKRYLMGIPEFIYRAIKLRR